MQNVSTYELEIIVTIEKEIIAILCKYFYRTKTRDNITT